MTDSPEEQLEVPDISDAAAAVEVPELYEMSLDVTIEEAGPVSQTRQSDRPSKRHRASPRRNHREVSRRSRCSRISSGHGSHAIDPKAIP